MQPESITVIAVDPGPTQSAYVLLEANGTIRQGRKADNEDVLYALGYADDSFHSSICVCERIRSYGMPAGAELFETCEWSGRFQQAWVSKGHTFEWHWMARKDVKLNLCGNPRAKDANIRQALIDRYGGKERAIGCKKSPGPLYGISGDVWAALSVAVTWQDARKAGRL
jgi:hypothetical protein